jgi:hypothetical protein
MDSHLHLGIVPHCIVLYEDVFPKAHEKSRIFLMPLFRILNMMAYKCIPCCGIFLGAAGKIL